MARSDSPQSVSDGDVYYHVQHGSGVDHDEKVLEIGIFPSLKSARAVVEKLKKKPGFRLKGGKFWISRGKVGQIGWAEGFVSVELATPNLGKSKKSGVARSKAGKPGIRAWRVPKR